MKKIKSRVGVLRSVKHNTRENIPENADKKLTPNNKTNGDTKICMERYTEKLPKKVRKNAVHAVEVLMTASPDFTGDWNKFLSNSREWSDKLFGGAENCVSWAIHLDESTPHIHAIYLPLVDGKLNAKKVIGGPSNKMQLLQTDYYKNVGKKFDMERGVKNNHAHHQEIKKFNKYVQETTKELENQKKKIKEKQIALKKQKQNIIEFAKITGKESFEFNVFKMGKEDLKTAYQKKINEVGAEFAEALKSQVARAEKAEEEVAEWESFTPEHFKKLEKIFDDHGVKNTKELIEKKTNKQKGRSR